MLEDPAVGECVVIEHPAPPNPYLEGVVAHIKEVTPYGVLLATDIGSGEYRATLDELTRPADMNGKFHHLPQPPKPPGHRPQSANVGYDGQAVSAAGGASDRSQSKSLGYTGDPCGKCGSLTLRRTGVCTTCDTCGDNSGCS